MTTATSTYAWCITEDKLDFRLCGITGPRNHEFADAEAIRKHPDAKKFRVLDDDGTVYYYGYFVDLTGDHDGLEPLDDFGEPSLGATAIQYQNDAGEYETR